MKNIEEEYEQIKKEIEDFVNNFHENEKVLTNINKYYKGIQVLFSPLIKNPTFMFIGINPGMGFSKAEKRNVKRYSPLKFSEYSWGDYSLARETRKLFKLANIPEFEIKNTVKSNCFFFATQNEKELYALLSHLKQFNVYNRSKKWINSIVQIISPKIIICEGQSAFYRFIKNKNCFIENNGKVLYAKHNDIHIIGYKRIYSNIRNINEVAKLLQDISADIQYKY